MPVFDFDTATTVFTSAGFGIASAIGQVSDDGVTFTLTASGAANSGNFISVGVRDDAGAGLAVSGNDTNAVQPLDRITLTFELASPTANRTAFATASNPVLQVNGTNVTGSVQGGGSSIVFTFSNPDRVLDIATLSVNFTCFCAGTQIATADGSKAVETLRAGDLVRLADGRDVLVRWLGRQHVRTAVSNPAKANPIRIMRGALGGGLPERDLRVSPDHGICIDDFLINAGALVNGMTIYQERDVSEDFTYYHIETDAHELILAEGVAAETFIDYTTRDTFENAHEAPNRAIEEMPLPRISSARLVPEPIKRALRPVIAAE